MEDKYASYQAPEKFGKRKKQPNIGHIQKAGRPLRLKQGGLTVSKETVVLRRWGRETQNFGVDKVNWPP